MPLALLLFLAAYHDVRVVDQTYQIPPGNWRYLDAADFHHPEPDWRDRPAVLEAAFAVESGPPVRLLLLDRAGLDQLQQGGAPAPLQSTPSGRGGMLTERSGSPGDCVFVLENRASQQTAIVRLRVTMASWDAAVLSPQRKLWVLAISFGLFFATVSYSAAKLWRVFRR